jgi:Thermolysin metallopeptidase, alpha-helical domain/Fungalysin/Thermolysin Propeptide Motif
MKLTSPRRFVPSHIETHAPFSRAILSTLLALSLMNAFAGLAPVAARQGAGSRPIRIVAAGAAAAASATEVVAGEQAERLLDGRRRELLAELKSRSNGPVDITLDTKSGAILTLNLDYPAEAVNAGDTEGRAFLFLNRFQELIDPRVRPSEYVALNENRGCDGSVVILDRAIGGRKVLGSKLTMHFSRDGGIAGVVNGVASVKGDVLPAVRPPVSRPRSKGKRTKSPGPGLCHTYSVLAPDTAGGGLRDASLRVWSEPDRAGMHTFKAEIDGTAVGAPAPFVVTIASDAAGGAAQPGRTLPKYQASENTGLPASISYHSIGGVAVEKMPADRNPAEIVYRFLEQHPSLFRTGAPRCQYGIKQVGESPLLPGVTFVRLEQRYLGLRVFGAELVFEVHDAQKVMSIAGHVLPFISVDPTPRITPAEAIERTKQYLRRVAAETSDPDTPNPLWSVIERANPPTPELLVFPGELLRTPEKTNNYLAYKVTLDQFVFFIDARNGIPVFSFSDRPHQTINDGLAGSEFNRLSYVTVHSGGVPSGALTLNPDVLPTFTSISTVGSFYASLGWFGVNNRGGLFVANTNVTISAASGGCANAFFDSTITGEAFMCMGVGRQPDVVGHEFTHGVVAGSAGLIYLDESGALNEAYADLFGNLIFPDAIAPGASSGWLVGEPATVGGPVVGVGTVRDMATPGTFSQPGTMGAYISRSAPGSGCNILPNSCDSGFVHSNSGIMNRAHVLLAGAPGGSAPAPPLPGIGRPKLATLAFLVLTRRLSPWSGFIDAAVGMRDMANTLVLRGATAVGGTTFVQADADQVPVAFGIVGLSPDLASGWSEPAGGFSGTDTFFAASELTANGCAVTNITASLASPSGTLGADLSPATPVGTAVGFAGLWGINFTTPPGAGPPPIGTTVKTHTVRWFNVFGRKPAFATQVVADPPPGTVNCTTPPGSIPVERTSAVTVHSGLFGGGGTDVVGNNPSAMAGGCVVRRTEVELLDGAGGVVAGPSNGVTDSVFLFNLFGLPITTARTATIIATPGPRPPNLSATVIWGFGIGTDVRYRLRYYIDQPLGVSCNP